MRHIRLWLAAVALLAATPLWAQATGDDVAPALPAIAVPVATAPALPNDESVVASVDAYYAARPGTIVWLRDADTRAAAAKLPEMLRNEPLLVDGAALATRVETALASGQPADDATISAAWVRYVQRLKAPVTGVSYGDPALALQTPSVEAILASAASAPSLAAHIDQTAAVNPFFAALSETALKNGSASDPRVRATLDHLRLLPATGRAILVDVANAQLMMLEDGRVVDTMKVVVGKPSFPTPLLAGTIHYVTFNPYWHIPPDVARRKVAPVVLKRGVAYLKLARYQTVATFGGDKEQPIDPTTVDWQAVADGTANAYIRQLTGPQNMMGKMKFGFVNDYGIFLHDTPHKDFFAKAKRNLSLGCVRLEHPEALAKWLLGREPVAPGDDAEENVEIDHGVPIYISYLTARPDGDNLAFADDVYGLDGPPAASSVKTASAKR